MTSEFDQSTQPYEWIQLELLPLPQSIDRYDKILLWWNPDKRELMGEQADLILNMVDEALKKGASGPRESVELSDPLGKPTELAAVLGQHFWVIPQPVRTPGVYVAPPESEAPRTVHKLQ